MSSGKIQTKMAAVSLNDTDTKPYPQLQVTFNGQPKNVIRLEPYGTWSMPPKNSLAVLFTNLSQESTVFAISNDYLNRPKNLKEGEVVHGAWKFGGFTYYDVLGQSSIVGKKVYLGSKEVNALSRLCDALENIATVMTFGTAVGATTTAIDPSVVMGVVTEIRAITGSAPNVN